MLRRPGHVRSLYSHCFQVDLLFLPFRSCRSRPCSSSVKILKSNSMRVFFLFAWGQDSVPNLSINLFFSWEHFFGLRAWKDDCTVKYWKKRLFPKHLQTLASLLGLLPLRSKVKEKSWERDKKKRFFLYLNRINLDCTFYRMLQFFLQETQIIYLNIFWIINFCCSSQNYDNSYHLYE